MYHYKTAKQVLTLAGRTHAQRAVMLNQVHAMNYFMVNKAAQRHMMAQVAHRQFSLPAHQKLEMPNLSPTMEKVSSSVLCHILI